MNGDGVTAIRELRARSGPGSADRTRGTQLTERKLQVLTAIAGGGTNRGVARSLLVSESTVKTYLLHLYPNLGVKNRAAAGRVVFERGLLGQ